jgi:hypothetical protein
MVFFLVATFFSFLFRTLGFFLKEKQQLLDLSSKCTLSKQHTRSFVCSTSSIIWHMLSFYFSFPPPYHILNKIEKKTKTDVKIYSNSLQMYTTKGEKKTNIYIYIKKGEGDKFSFDNCCLTNKGFILTIWWTKGYTRLTTKIFGTPIICKMEFEFLK